MGKNISDAGLEKVKAFDEFVRKTILEEGNRLVTEEELNQIDLEQNID